MSRGSFCRSPSEVTMQRPRAWSKPAANAAVCPKLRRKRMTRRRGSPACSRARISKLSSVLPSSTTMISYGRPQAVERVGELAVQLLERRRLVPDRDDDAQLEWHRGSSIISHLSGARRRRASGPEQVAGRSRPRGTPTGVQRRRPAMVADERHGLLAVPDGQQPLGEVADAAADQRSPIDEPPDADARRRRPAGRRS